MASKAEQNLKTIALEPLPLTKSRMPGAQTALLRDSMGYLMSKVVPGFFGLVSVPVFVRLLGMEEYGRLSVILPILLALVGAGSGWLQQSVLRFHPAPEDSCETKSSFADALRLGMIYAVLALGLTLMPVLALLHMPWTIWGVAEAYCAIQLVYLVWLTQLQAQLEPRAVLTNEAIRAAAGFVLPVGLLLLASRRSFVWVLLGLTLGYALPLALGGGKPKLGKQFLWRRDVHHWKRDGEELGQARVLRNLWRFGWAVGIWLMLCQALPIVGRSAIQRYLGYAQAGVYASLYELAVRLFSLFAMPVTQAAHPRIMREWNAGNHAAARRIIAQAIGMQILMFVPIEAIGIAFAVPLTRLALGKEPRVSASLLPWLMLGGFLWQIALLVHKPLEIMQRTRTMLGGMLGVVLIECAGNYWLVPRFGVHAVVYVFVTGAAAYIIFAAAQSLLPRERRELSST
jgi:O-antigen/teichoic acid export membrane protein